MYILYKSFYVQVGLDTRMFYKAISWALDPVTKQKISLTWERDPAELKTFYHPSQLEKRFGGTAETPTNFWPPYVGEKFFPDDETSHLDIMDETSYLKTLVENPLLPKRPDLIKNSSENTRDFMFEEMEEEMLLNPQSNDQNLNA